MKAELKFGYYSSIILVVITLITFAFALTAIPIAGTFCPSDCVEYPYLNTIQQFLYDFRWIYFAIVMLISFLAYMISLHYYSSRERKIFSQIALIIATISATVLLADYFIQISVVPASLLNGEVEGIPLIIQYNPHGIFIALEELGYILMSISFLFVAQIFNKDIRIENYIKWIFIISFILVLLSFIVVTFNRGLVRKDQFEVYVISIDWLVLIVNGILMSIVFKRKLGQLSNKKDLD
ncbi:MAG: hypothetical protein MUP82_08455, partial [Candidatus Marinimicrobia bacterium]|nr:hypothetical protein [Candidatus Neomarinimicrobiota bacterium]